MRINKLWIENKVKIELAHPTNNKSNKSNKNKQRKPRTIAIDLHGYKIKILRNASKLKDRNIFINEDFSVKTLKTLREEAYFQCFTVIVNERKGNSDGRKYKDTFRQTLSPYLQTKPEFAPNVNFESLPYDPFFIGEITDNYHEKL